MKGIAAQVFAPNANMTRGQLVTVLYRLAGEPETQNTYPFTDVSQTSYCAKAVAWAYENGLTKGVTGTQFAPNHPVTREQMVTFFARYALYMGEEVTGEGDLSAFTAGNQVSPYARTAMAWAVETGLIKGMGNHTVSPKGMATRAQTAAILMRYCKIFD